MIAIPASPGAAGAAQPKAVNRLQYWMNFYRNHGNENRAIENFRDTLTFLNHFHKFEDAQAAITAFMTNHPKSIEPWMYDALALAIKMNKGREEDFKTALNYAADMAEQSHNPNHLVNAADMLFLHGYYGRVGKLLDEAADLVPHQANPLIMSINLALKTKDPKRMAASVEKLLSLGWPGQDERIRRDAHRMVEKLAKTLREDGREKEADELLAKLPEAEARDLYIRLSWVGRAGLDLKVEDPLGVTASVLMPRSVGGGSLVKNGHGPQPEDIYVCPRGFDGNYTIRVEIFFNDPEKPATTATLEVIQHEGTPWERKETQTIVLGDKPPAPVVVYLKGGRRTAALPFVAPLKPEPPVAAKPKAKKAVGDARKTPSETR